LREFEVERKAKLAEASQSTDTKDQPVADDHEREQEEAQEEENDLAEKVEHSDKEDQSGLKKSEAHSVVEGETRNKLLHASLSRSATRFGESCVFSSFYVDILVLGIPLRLLLGCEYGTSL
jgi:hypothetical protein